MGWIASVRIDSCGMKSMSAAEFVSLTVDNRRVASVTLNRPDAKNALSNELMCELREAVGEIRHDASIRAVILSNAGDVFCAGGDLKGMNRQKQNSREGRIADAMEFAATLRELNELPQLVIGRINGSAFGGGVGLISLCASQCDVPTHRSHTGIDRCDDLALCGCQGGGSQFAADDA
jgi:methylglutaconyl-CoA hydratase